VSKSSTAALSTVTSSLSGERRKEGGEERERGKGGEGEGERESKREGGGREKAREGGKE
jgi:hypothetical protein